MREHIIATHWLNTKDINVLNNRLKVEEIEERHFNFGPGKRISLETAPPSAWSQAFLPHVYIGNGFAMLGHYEVSQSAGSKAYPTYDLIVDLSRSNFEDESNKFSYRPVQPAPYHHRLSIEDIGTNFAELYELLQKENIFQKITEAREQGTRVLINCQAGQSRSATVAILYLMETFNIDAIQAYHHLRAQRPEVAPNPGYFAALLQHRADRSYNMASPVVKSWLDDYLTTTPQASFAWTPKKNQQGITSVILSPTAEPRGFTSTDFINVTSFLTVIGVPFNTVQCGKHFGCVELTPEASQRMQLFFVTRYLPEALEAAMNNMSTTLFVSDYDQKYQQLKQLKEQCLQYDSLENMVEFIRAASEPRGGLLNFFKAPFGETRSAKAFYQVLRDHGISESFLADLQARAAAKGLNEQAGVSPLPLIL